MVSVTGALRTAVRTDSFRALTGTAESLKNPKNPKSQKHQRN
jgi:hypothetical protein